jgi:hypothetical protein
VRCFHLSTLDIRHSAYVLDSTWMPAPCPKRPPTLRVLGRGPGRSWESLSRRSSGGFTCDGLPWKDLRRRARIRLSSARPCPLRRSSTGSALILGFSKPPPPPPSMRRRRRTFCVVRLRGPGRSKYRSTRRPRAARLPSIRPTGVGTPSPSALLRDPLCFGIRFASGSASLRDPIPHGRWRERWSQVHSPNRHSPVDIFLSTAAIPQRAINLDPSHPERLP